MKLHDQLGAGIHGSPHKDSLGVTANVGHQLVQLQESAAQSAKEQIVQLDGLVTAALQPALDSAFVASLDARHAREIHTVGQEHPF